MASFWRKSAILVLCLWALLISPSVSLNCASQTFAGKNLYEQCLDLPTLSAYLHYTYDATNGTVAVAFSAAPAKPTGWIAWGINPSGEGMMGTQALVAYKGSSNGAVSVKTYSLDSYTSVVPSKLSLDVWDLKAEENSDGSFTIFGKVKVPQDLAAAGSLNYVWQVGPEETADGELRKHAFQTENLESQAVLKLVDKAVVGPDSPAGAPASEENGSAPAENGSVPAENGSGLVQNPSDGSRIGSRTAAFYMGLIGIAGSFFIF